MSYNTGQGQFSPRGNMWAMIKQIVNGQGAINPSMRCGAGSGQVVKSTYDFSIDGGAIGTITPRGSRIIPAGAIVYGGLIDGITLPVSVGAATIAIGFGSGAQVASLKAATAIATYTAGGILALIPVWTAASAVKVAADTAITFTIATEVLTAGKIAVQIYYHMAGE